MVTKTDLAAAALLAAGCSFDVPPVGPPLTRTYDYAVSVMAVDPGADPAVAHTGFNLDAHFSTSTSPSPCGPADFTSALDLDQNLDGCSPGAARCAGGVDNQLPALLAAARGAGATDVAAALASAVQDGRVVLLLRVEDVDGALGPTLDDEDVTVKVFRGRPLTPASRCAALYADEAPFAVDTSSLTDPDDLDTARVMWSGRIVRGRLRITEASTALSIPLSATGAAPALVLNGPYLRADLLPARGSRGNLGGAMLRAECGAFLGPTFVTPTVAAALCAARIDLTTQSSCVAPRGAVSLGLSFALTRAAIAEAAVTGPQSGMCGTLAVGAE